MNAWQVPAGGVEVDAAYLGLTEADQANLREALDTSLEVGAECYAVLESRLVLTVTPDVTAVERAANGEEPDRHSIVLVRHMDGRSAHAAPAKPEFAAALLAAVDAQRRAGDLP